jgi:hypothetical protein
LRLKFANHRLMERITNGLGENPIFRILRCFSPHPNPLFLSLLIRLTEMSFCRDLYSSHFLVSLFSEFDSSVVKMLAWHCLTKLTALWSYQKTCVTSSTSVFINHVTFLRSYALSSRSSHPRQQFNATCVSTRYLYKSAPYHCYVRAYVIPCALAIVKAQSVRKRSDWLRLLVHVAVRAV